MPSWQRPEPLCYSCDGSDWALKLWRRFLSSFFLGLFCLFDVSVSIRFVCVYSFFSIPFCFSSWNIVWGHWTAVSEAKKNVPMHLLPFHHLLRENKIMQCRKSYMDLLTAKRPTVQCIDGNYNMYSSWFSIPLWRILLLPPPLHIVYFRASSSLLQWTTILYLLNT